jgi:hypothetical protein
VIASRPDADPVPDTGGEIHRPLRCAPSPVKRADTGRLRRVRRPARGPGQGLPRLGLDQDSYEQVVAALELLADRGPQLGRPLVDTVVRSRHKEHEGAAPGIEWAVGTANPICL